MQEEADRVDARMQEAITGMKEAMRRQAEQGKENAELANQMRESIKGAAAEYVCPLTLELLVDPVMAKDGRIYERSHILAWLSRNATSPITREPMGTELTPVPLLGTQSKSSSVAALSRARSPRPGRRPRRGSGRTRRK